MYYLAQLTFIFLGRTRISWTVPGHLERGERKSMFLTPIISNFSLKGAQASLPFYESLLRIQDYELMYSYTWLERSFLRHEIIPLLWIGLEIDMLKRYCANMFSRRQLLTRSSLITPVSGISELGWPTFVECISPKF